MPKKDRALPKPPVTPFGKMRGMEYDGTQGALLADQIAKALAHGSLDDFLDKEMPDNEHAKALAAIMLGLTGMMPSSADISAKSEKDKEKEYGAQTREEAVKAAQEGDVQNLVSLLAGEHQKRMSGIKTSSEKETEAHSSNQSTIDKDIIDKLIEISKNNNVTLDWIILRALKLYAEEYHKTGRL